MKYPMQIQWQDGTIKKLAGFAAKNNGNAPELQGRDDAYSFNILKSTFTASGNAYAWCWGENENLPDGFSPALMGLSLVIVGFAATGGNCSYSD